MTCAANRVFGRFPKNKAAVMWMKTAAGYEVADVELRARFLKAELSAEDSAAVFKALEACAEHWPRTWCMRREALEHAQRIKTRS